jgi:phosphoglycolate phosphatase
MGYKAIIFDLDGTLVNSLEDIADSLNKVLVRHKFPTHKYSEYLNFIGEGARMLVKRALPTDIQDDDFVQQILKEYNAEYQKWCTTKTRVYPGIFQLFDELNSRRVSINVLSNKPDEFTKMMCRHYFAQWKLDIIFGQRKDVPRKPDPSAVNEILSLLGMDSSSVLYVGDSGTDIETALNARLTAVAVTWGFRPKEFLEKYHPDYIIDEPSQILELL